MKRPSWSEEYRCGCISAEVPRQADLTGYCGKHGDSRRQLFHLPATDEAKAEGQCPTCGAPAVCISRELLGDQELAAKHYLSDAAARIRKVEWHHVNWQAEGGIE